MKYGIVWLLICVALCNSSIGIAIELYVAPYGNDGNPGTLERPFQTIKAARDAIKASKCGNIAEKTTVYLRGGSYYLEQPLELAAIDSGSKNTPVIYCAFKNEKVHLLGGKLIPASAFKPVVDANIRNHIVEVSARDKVLAADLVGIGFNPDEIGQMERFGFGSSMRPAPSELFFDHEPMTIARWPNEGYVKIEKVIRSGSRPRQYRRDINRDFKIGPTYVPGIFKYQGDRPKHWVNAREVWLHGYWAYDWADDCISVSYIDPNNSEITLSAPHEYGLTGVLGQGQRYYALNMLEEIDMPGEYYIDTCTGVLYFYPPAELKDKIIGISLLTEPLLKMQDVSNVTFEGITFEMCRNTAIVVEGGTGNTLAGCTVRNTGGWAMRILGGSKHTIESCDIYNVGRGGIYLTGGDQKTLTRADHKVINNHIHHFSRRAKTYQFAVAVDGVGNLVSNNLIHDAPHAAIDYRGNYNTIELNEIHHVCLESDDSGAINSDKDYSICGNTIRHNYFHDIIGLRPDSPWLGAHMIYYDSCVSGELISGNIFEKGGREAITINGGRDVTVENNVFIDLKHPVGIDPIGVKSHRHVVVTAYQNMVKKINHLQPPWSTAFPKLAKYPSDFNELAIPVGNMISGNLFCRTENINLKVDPNIVHIENNRESDQYPFVRDSENKLQFRHDLKVLDEMPAIKSIPLNKIGLYKDRYRHGT